MPTSTPLSPGRTPIRFAVAPTSVYDDHPIIPTILDSLELIAARQRRDGSWGRGSALDKLICTCHATMALLAGGYGTSDIRLERARQWLCGPSMEEHNNSYWILAPLASWFEKSENATTASRRQIEKLCIAIDRGAQPHPDQFIQYFYLYIAERLPELRDDRIVARYLAYIKDQWSSDHGWARRPDTTTVCYAVLRSFNDPFADGVKVDVIRLLDTWADHPEPKYTSWRNPVSTAYTIMNIVESGLMAETAVREQVDQAVAWLIAKRGRDGLWVSDVPYGGSGDIKSSDFPTAAIVRSLLAYLSTQMSSAPAPISAVRLGRLGQKLRRQLGWTIFWLLCTVSLATFTVGPSIALSIEGWVDIERAGLIMACVGVVIGVVAWLFPDVRENLFVWVRRRLT